MAKPPDSEKSSVGWTGQVTDRPNLGVPVVLLLMVSTVMMTVLTFAGATRLDRNAETSAQAMAQSLLLQARRDLAQSALDVAGTAEFAHRLAGDGQEAWLANYLGEQLRHPLGLDSGWILDGDDRPRIGFIGDRPAAADPFDVMPSGLVDLVAAARREPSPATTGHHGLLLFDGAIHVVATVAVDLPDTPDWKRSVLVFTKALDRSYLSKLEALNFVDEVALVGTLPDPLPPTPPSGLFDPEGRILGYLSLEIVPPGTDLLKQIWPAVASAFASMLLLVGLFVRRVDRTRQQRRRLEESLDRERDLRQIKSRFVNMVSHEIRTPLTTIRTATDLLDRYGEQMDRGERSRELAAIQREIDVITVLVEDVMAIGRTEGEDFSLRRRATDPAEFTKRIWEELARAHGTTRRLDLDSGEVGGELDLDPTLLRPILANLLGNAIKFSPENQPIHVRLASDERELTLSVRDHGIGIPADQLEAVFTPFHRADNVGAVSGSGLGLTITKQAVERHGGVLKIESTVGEGTWVFVRLPLVVDGEDATGSEAEVA